MIHFLLIFLALESTYSADFSVEFYPNKTKINSPSPESSKDKKNTVIIENNLMSNLIIQIITSGEIISNKSIPTQMTESVTFIRDLDKKYFIRTIQPASNLIELNFLGRQIEIP